MKQSSYIIPILIVTALIAGCDSNMVQNNAPPLK